MSENSYTLKKKLKKKKRKKPHKPNPTTKQNKITTKPLQQSQRTLAEFVSWLNPTGINLATRQPLDFTSNLTAVVNQIVLINAFMHKTEFKL